VRRRDRRARLSLPIKYSACHKAQVAGYALEGHVPAREVLRLIEEQPAAVGLAVPACHAVRRAWTGRSTAGAAIRSMFCWCCAMAAPAFTSPTVRAPVALHQTPERKST
jgi:Protein of unknown function, DUF